MGMTTPFPEPESPGLRRFVVAARPQIVGLLRMVCDRDVPLNLFVDEDAGFDVSALLTVDEPADRMLVAAPSAPSVRRRMLVAPTATFVGFIDGDKVQFSVPGAATAAHAGRTALSVPLPAQVLRLQRRAAVRARTNGRGATCRIPVPGSCRGYEEVQVLDIGTGGVALLAGPGRFGRPIGAQLDACRLNLPGVGGAEVGLRVRHAESTASGSGGYVCGCEFVQLTPAVRAMIGRYVALCGPSAGEAGCRSPEERDGRVPQGRQEGS
jgi:c-di-GMP-binding flagellar brake protein YcgR